MRLAELDKRAAAARRDASGGSETGDTLQHLVRALKTLQRDDTPADGDGALADIEPAEHFGGFRCTVDIAPVFFARYRRAERADGGKKVGGDLMGTDDTPAVSLDQPDHHLQHLIVAA